MKKFLYSFITISSFAFYALYQNKLHPNPNPLAVVSAVAPTATATPAGQLAVQDPPSGDPPHGSSSSSPVAVPAQAQPATQPAAAKPSPSPAPAPTAQPKPAPAPAPAPTPTPQPKGQYVDGQYTGSVADAYYGNIQVQATVSGGKITDVVFLQYPSDRSTSRYINSQAMPYLKAEAIQTQSANVDIVSGATDSSMAFRQSLASALVKAKN